MHRKLWVLVLCGAALPFLVGCEGNLTASPNPETPATKNLARRLQVRVAPAQAERLSREATFTGNLLPRRYTRIVPEVDGVVQSISAVGPRIQIEMGNRRYDEQLSLGYGQTVRAGDVLVQLDTRDLELAVRLAEARVQQVEADLAKLKAWQRPEEVARQAALRDEAKARYDQAYRTYERVDALRNQNVVSASEHDRVVTDVATAKAQYDSARANLATAEAGPTAEELAVQAAVIAHAKAEAAMKRRELEKATIRAPYDGVVTAVNVEVGERISAAHGAAIEMMDLHYLIAEVGLPAGYVGKVRVHDLAAVSTASSTQRVPAVVIAVNEVVDPATRTFQIRVAVDNAEGAFKAGQFARVHLQLDTDPAGETLSVPSAAIVFREGQPHVFRIDGERVALTPVTLGMNSGDRTEILAGLQQGETVVVDDPNLLSDGMQVNVRP